MATDVNNENTRSRMEASSAGKRKYRGAAKEDESNTGHIWAAGFHHAVVCSCLAHIFKLMNRLFV
jgi:hypothetical protein